MLFRSYTAICLQCMNIVKRYGSIYWNCACLIVNSGSTDEDDVENNGGVNYGRIAKAMGNMMQHGIKIALPDLNRAHFGFYPDVADGEVWSRKSLHEVAPMIRPPINIDLIIFVFIIYILLAIRMKR